MRSPVPEVPREMTGPCIYGHIITNKHIDYFRDQHPDTEEFQIDNPKALVSYASVCISQIHLAHTATVFDDQGDKAVCLILVANRRCLRDMRWADGFMTKMETALGITGKPNWYACYSKHRQA